MQGGQRENTGLLEMCQGQEMDQHDEQTARDFALSTGARRTLATT